jgi:hypothetical protein
MVGAPKAAPAITTMTRIALGKTARHRVLAPRAQWQWLCSPCSIVVPETVRWSQEKRLPEAVHEVIAKQGSRDLNQVRRADFLSSGSLDHPTV